MPTIIKPMCKTEIDLQPIEYMWDWVGGMYTFNFRNGVQPHNHHRDNILAIQAKSIANGLQRQMDRSEAAGALPPFTPQLSAQRICMFVTFLSHQIRPSFGYSSVVPMSSSLTTVEKHLGHMT